MGIKDVLTWSTNYCKYWRDQI